MRPPPVPIRRVLRGTEFVRKEPYPYKTTSSPAVQSLLAEPTWSVRSLLPPSKEDQPTSATPPTSPDPEITPAKLRHLLRLSALPLPKSQREEISMLHTLREQIHFVRAVQSVDTTGVDPLITIRDESPEAVEEQTINLETMRPYLELESPVGKNGTVRRREVPRTAEEDRVERRKWEVDVGDLGVGSEQRRKRGYFYVRRKKQGKGQEEVKHTTPVGDGEGEGKSGT